jgi:thiamine biosynthesis lipoprotein
MNRAASTRARLSRRYVLKITAAALAVPAGILALRELAPPFAAETWQGESLGGRAAMTRWHPNAAGARRSLSKMLAEVARLDAVFSLYRPDSEISRLNRDGIITAPSSDLVEVVEAAMKFAELSGGAFDPTVQPLWTLYDSHFRARPLDTAGPEQNEIERSLRRIGYSGIDVGPSAIAFARPLMEVTLNGIAQGYITDRIADLLRQEGFEHAMVELGETRAIGASIDGAPFSVGLQDPREPGSIDRHIALADAALSVSGGYGTPFGNSLSHHIFNPATGLSAKRLLDVAVTHRRAMTADALSTAIFVAGEEAAPRILVEFPDAQVWLTRMDGAQVSLG